MTEPSNPIVTLRAVEPEDADFMFSADNDEECRIFSDYVAPLSRKMLRDYAESYDADPFSAGQLRLIVESEGVPVGIADIYEISMRDSKAFVGIYIIPGMRSRGIGLAALHEVSNYVEKYIPLNQLVARVPVHNHASRRLFEKAGYEAVAVLPEWHRTGKNLSDVLIYRKKPVA